jgi:hypothetical protein
MAILQIRGAVMVAIIGAAVLLGALNFSPMISLKTPGMQEYQAYGLTVWAEPKDEAEAGRIAKPIADSRDRITGALGNSDDAGIEIIIYPHAGALKRKTIGFAGFLLPDWYIGKNSRDKVLITSPARPGPSHSRESVEQAAVHEYVHVLTDRQNKGMEYWLKEGFALYLAGQEPTAEMVRAARDISWEEFTRTNAIQFARVGGYALAYTLVEFMEETWGWERVLGFLEPGTGYEEVTGMSKRELFEAWKLWLEDV